MSEVKTQKNNTIYALHYKSQLMGTFKWGEGMSDFLQGWRPPKKVYFTVGTANNGASHLPTKILDDVELVEYQPVKTIKKYSSKEKERKYLTNQIKKNKNILDYYIRSKNGSQFEIERVNETIEKLKKELSKL